MRPPLAGCWLLDRQLVVSAAKVLHQGIPGQHDRGTAVLFAPAHRPQPRLHPPVVALDAVVGVLVGPMPRRRQQVIEHRRIRRCPVGGDLDRQDPGRADRPLNAPTGSRRVPPWSDEHVDDLPELVDRAIDAAPLPATFTSVSSTCQRSPTACQHGRAASASSGVNRCTQR